MSSEFDFTQMQHWELGTANTQEPHPQFKSLGRTRTVFFYVYPSLHLGKNDLLTFYDGDDLTANILGQYSGTRPHFKLYTSMADVTIQFQSDPATNIYGYNNGFVVHFFGKRVTLFFWF